MKEKKVIQEIIRIILQHASPDRIYLYGSRVNGENKKNSDIDVAYDDEKFKKNFAITEEIEKLDTLLKIDITNLAQAEERFKNRVQSTGRVIYSSSKKLRVEDGLYNFTKALKKFSLVVGREKEYQEKGFSDIYLDLVVKRFEFTYEMSWKAVKRVLDYLGIECFNPRSCFKEAYAQGIIKEELIWLEMIEMRNLSSHVYDEEEIKEILERVADFKDAFGELKKNIKGTIKNWER